MPVWRNVHVCVCARMTTFVYTHVLYGNVNSMTELGTDGLPVILSSFHSLTPDEAHTERERESGLD